MNALEIKNLSKEYPHFRLDRLSLTLPGGCIMGLVGENGAGKSTTIKLLLDMIHREKAPYWVTVDGKEIPHFLHRRKFEETDCGWYYSQTLKSVLVKYPNPKKDYQVVVSFEQFDLIGM